MCMTTRERLPPRSEVRGEREAVPRDPGCVRRAATGVGRPLS